MDKGAGTPASWKWYMEKRNRSGSMWTIRSGGTSGHVEGGLQSATLSPSINGSQPGSGAPAAIVVRGHEKSIRKRRARRADGDLLQRSVMLSISRKYRKR